MSSPHVHDETTVDETVDRSFCPVDPLPDGPENPRGAPAAGADDGEDTVVDLPPCEISALPLPTLDIPPFIEPNLSMAAEAFGVSLRTVVDGFSLWASITCCNQGPIALRAIITLTLTGDCDRLSWFEWDAECANCPVANLPLPPHTGVIIDRDNQCVTFYDKRPGTHTYLDAELGGRDACSGETRVHIEFSLAREKFATKSGWFMARIHDECDANALRLLTKSLAKDKIVYRCPVHSG